MGVQLADADVMPATVMFSVVLVGAGAAVAAVVGLLLPEGERLSAALPLVLGAGIGVAALAIGAFVEGKGTNGVVLVATAAGFVAVMVGLTTLWRRVQRAEPRQD